MGALAQPLRIEEHGTDPNRRGVGVVWGWADGGMPQIVAVGDATMPRNLGNPVEDRWHFGSLGKAETRRCVETCTAPGLLRDAFEAERNRWATRARAMAEAVPSRRRQARFRDVGEEVDVGRYLSDRPDCWLRMERGKSLPSITLGINIALSCGNAETDFVGLASRAIACAWALCEAGYPVRIVYCAPLQWVHRYGSCRGEWGGVAWVAKGWQEPLDVERLLVGGLQGFYRDSVFGAWECMGVGDKKGVYTHGKCMNPPAEVARSLGVDLMVGKSWAPVSEDGERIAQAMRFDDFERKGAA